MYAQAVMLRTVAPYLVVGLLLIVAGLATVVFSDAVLLIYLGVIVICLLLIPVIERWQRRSGGGDQEPEA
jgi:ABC-type transport system involved in cytochrome bd biosynthesis fused ATPase/permease subunit